MNSCSSANAITSSKRALASLRLSPSMIALMITLSRAVRSMLKPTPSSMKGDSRPAIEIRPVSTP